MISKQNIKYFIYIAFITIVLYKLIDNPSHFISGIGSIASFFSPFLVGILFALLLDPIVMFIEKRIKTNRLFNICIAYILIVLIVLIGIKLLIPALVDTLTELIIDIPYYINELDKFLLKTISSTQFLTSLAPHIQESLNNMLQKIVGLLTRLSSDTFEYMLSIASIFFNIIMGIILSIYILYDKEKIGLGFKKCIYAFFSNKKANYIVIFGKKTHDIFYSYIFGKVIDSLIVGVLAFIGFKFVIRIDNVVFLSIVIFVTNMIPYFGPFIGAIAPIFMTLTHNPVKALWVAIFILILQQIDGNFIGPKVMGEQVGLSPLWIISSVLIGGSLFGVVGVFLSVPIAAVIKSSIDSYVEKKIHTKDSL